MIGVTGSSDAKWGDLGVRALSAAVLIPAVLADVWAGGIWFHLFVALIGVLMAQEWVAIVHRGDPLQFALHAAGAMCGALLPLDVGLGGGLAAIVVLVLASAGLAAVRAPGGAAWSYLGVLYVSVPPIALVLLREDPDHGIAAIVLVMVMVWAADTFAYFFGRILGGPKLAPRISPKKTWAGLAGAMTGSALAGLLVGVWLAVPSLAGLVVVRDDARLAALRHVRELTGATPGTLEVFLALRGLRTLALRLERSQQSAQVLAERLSVHPAVTGVRYPGLSGHPTHAAARRQLAGFGMVISFDVRGTAAAADAVCAGVRLIRHATSLGAVESTMERRAAVPGQEHLPPTLLRLSVGIESVDDLWRDLDAALQQSQAVVR